MTGPGLAVEVEEANPNAAVQRVVERLRDRIRRGLAAPGQRLVEADLVADTGAPRTKVREALRQLQLEGLVAIEPFRGASVRRFSRDEVREIYAVREALEGLAARLAAERETAEARGRLQDRQAELGARLAEGDAAGFADANRAWRAALLNLAGNATLVDSLERLHTPTLRLLFQSFYARDAIGRAESTLSRVTGSVLAGDGPGAEAAMRAHVRDGLAAIEALDDEVFG